MPSTLRPRRVHRGDRLASSYINSVGRASLQRITVLGGRAQHVGNSVAIQVDPPNAPQGVIPTWPGVIQSSQLQTGHNARWVYGVDKIKYIDTNSTPSIFEFGYEVLTGDEAFSVNAYNVIELAHAIEPADTIAWYVWGVNVHGDGYKATSFLPLPVGGGVDVPVQITERVISNNSTKPDDPATLTIYTFEAMGSHDGSCT